MTKCTNLNKSKECSLEFVEIKEENFEEIINFHVKEEQKEYLPEISYFLA